MIDFLRQTIGDVGTLLTLIGVIAMVWSFGTRIGRLEGKLDSLDARMSRVENSVDELNKNVSKLTGMFETFLAMRQNPDRQTRKHEEGDE